MFFSVQSLTYPNFISFTRGTLYFQPVLSERTKCAARESGFLSPRSDSVLEFGTKRSQVQILSPRPKICLKITIFRLFCYLILLDFLSKIPYSLSKSGFQRTSPLFGCHRMTTDKGGLMELRVWFRCHFSVRNVHWQKWAEKGRQCLKQSRSQIA